VGTTGIEPVTPYHVKVVHNPSGNTVEVTNLPRLLAEVRPPISVLDTRGITERILNILLPFCYPIRWQRTTQADIGWIGVAKISKDNSTLRNWPLQVEMAGAAFRVRCIQPLYILQWMIRALGSS
jgi:hypothetical protein